MNNSANNSKHAIRLHGPWMAEVLEWWSDCEVQQTSFRCTVPCDWEPWLGVNFCGRVKFVRPFGFPTGLEPDQTVVLFIERVDYQATIVLNDNELGGIEFGQSLRIPVRELLLPRNRLEVTIEMPKEANRAGRNGFAGGLIGAVALEIDQANLG